LPEADVSGIFLQIAKGVEHMQSQGVMHRDLKLGNILISAAKAIKIIDFGLAVRLEIGEQGE
jgi:serine/threonine protein kinase